VVVLLLGQVRLLLISRRRGVRRLFSWWCTLIFRPKGPSIGGGAKNILSGLLGGGGSGQTEMSGSMQGFMDCIREVDARLTATAGPWFFAEQDHPTMIDFVYVSHVERMLASCAYWKGLNLRDPKWNLTGLVRWIEAFEKREAYLAFKSDYYTHVKDIPPQYGPGYAGGFADDRQKFESSITGRDGKSWSLPLAHDDPLQPLYVGPPLPLCVLRGAGLHADDSDGSYVNCDPAVMADACRTMAAWKLAGNGVNIVKFASRGGPTGAKNARKTFQAELADPYAEPDPKVQPHVDAVLRIVCQSLMKGGDQEGLSSLRTTLWAKVPTEHMRGVIGSIAYLRDRIGVPRDLPLAAARHLRAHLNWAIDSFDG
jgi:glutathione S-transferase